MKKLFYYSIIALACFAANIKIFAQSANTTLSNLTSPTKVNANLLPDKDKTRNLGSATKGWRNLYLDSAVYLNGVKFISTPGTGIYRHNTAVGLAALTNITSGSYNTAIGNEALANNTTGIFNTANGADALVLNTTGVFNTAAGYGALFYNNDSYNTAIGNNTLFYTTASEYNTAVGYNAGGSYDNGYNNVFLGANTDVNYGDGYYNVIAIGQGTICSDNSQVTMGNSSTATYRAYANWTNISDRRFKKNIKENVPGLEFINKLQPITYTLDATGIDNFLHKDLPLDKQSNEKAKTVMNKALAEKEKVIYTGFVAQDVEKAAKSLNYDFSGVDAAKNDKDVYGLRYAEFVVPLVKAVQELSKQNDSLKNVFNEKFNEQQKQIDELKAMISSNPSIFNHQLATISSASLSQNIPNPFQNTTTINYGLPNQFTSAKIIVTDKSGKVLKEINISGTGKGSVNIDAATLSSGAYQYSLYVDGRMIDTKQMEHLK
jgi:hypothetical protein